MNVLLVGVSGRLGSLISRHLVEQPTIRLSVLSFGPSEDKTLFDLIQKSGGRIFKGDITKPETLDEPTKGMHTVISAIGSSDPRVFIDGQANLVKASTKNGVSRFVPSDFTINYHEFSKEELDRNPTLSAKRTFSEFLKSTPMKTLRFYQGQMMETFVSLQQQNGFGFYGEGTFPIEMTSYDSISRVVARAITNPDRTGSVVYIGDRLTYSQISEIYNKVRGTNVQPKRLGSRDELRNLYEERRKSGDPRADLLGLFLVTSDERSLFKKSDNSEFSDIKPITFEEFLKRNPESKISS